MTFDDFYTSEYSSMVKAISVLTRHRGDAEDAVQEAFCRALRDWDSLSHHPAPRAWLHLTASRIAISRWRHSRRQQALVEEWDLQSENDEHLRVDIFLALRTLDRLSRTVVYLFYFADQPVETIASLLGKPQGTIKSLLHRARTKLEREMS